MDELKSVLERVLREEEHDSGLVITDMNQEETNPGDNFLSEAFRVNVVGRTGSDEHYARRVFLKKTSDNKERRELCNMEEAFKNETFMYTKVLPLIPGVDEYIPKCLFANNKYVVMSDLQIDGYTMLDKKKGLNLAQAELVMKALGKLHAGTFNITLSKGPIELSNFLSETFNYYLESDVFPTFLTSAIESGLANLKTAGDKSLEPVIEKLANIHRFGNAIGILEKMHESEKLSLICHGDLWTNNMLFRIDEKNCANSVKLVDFQLVRKGSLAIDPLMFLYTSISPELLNAEYDYLVKVYSSAFIEALKVLRVAGDKIPTKEEIKAEIDSREFYGFMASLWYLPGMGKEWKETNADMDKILGDEDAILATFFSVNAEMTKRLAKLAKRCIDRGVF